MRVLIVTGGKSNERDISLISANNVIASLKKLNFQVEIFDFALGFEKFKSRVKEADVVFPVLHGIEGEGGNLQEFLEKLKVKFVGSGSKACRNGWDKIQFKKFCQKFGIKTSPWFILSPKSKTRLLAKIPFVIKPTNSGSSVDVRIIKSKEDLDRIDFERLFDKHNEVLVEDYIEGIEATVGVLGEKALPIVEIRPPKGEWFSFENKYSGRTIEIPNAPSLTLEKKKELQKIALRIHNQLGCRHFSRSDFIVAIDEVYALEINTIPGLTPQSLLPKAAEAAGITFDEMIKRLLKTAYGEKV